MGSVLSCCCFPCCGPRVTGNEERGYEGDSESIGSHVEVSCMGVKHFRRQMGRLPDMYNNNLVNPNVEKGDRRRPSTGERSGTRRPGTGERSGTRRPSTGERSGTRRPGTVERAGHRRPSTPERAILRHPSTPERAAHRRRGTAERGGHRLPGTPAPGTNNEDDSERDAPGQQGDDPINNEAPVVGRLMALAPEGQESALPN